ncbi:M56 family metallopeptidase [Allofournierella sp.]|uniref:M56 family metallopeptidase n=1 Tax=Allofournierella sp. TaxID=1940256 RepID=UPI003AB71717
MNWSSIFRVLVTLTLQGTVALALVALLNFVLGLFKAPRRVCALLWGVVLLRFLIPLSFPSPLSVYALKPVQQYFTGSRVTDSLVGEYEAAVSGTPEFEYAVAAGAQPRKIPGLEFEYAAFTRWDGKLYPARTLGGTYAPLLVRLWLGGTAFCLAVGLARYGLLRRRVRFAYKTQDGVYTGACVAAPFVLGFLRPRIYLPAGLSGPQREYILLHERTHLRRGDPWFKLAFSLAVCLHWWNPWVWMGYKCLLADIEAACDQAVLGALGSGVKADYSQSLLQFAAGPQPGLSTPLAFGETAVKARVKQVLRYKKPGTAPAALAVAFALLAACAVLADPAPAPAAAGAPQAAGATYRDQLTHTIAQLDAARREAGDSALVPDKFKKQLDAAYEQRVAELTAFDQRHAVYGSRSLQQFFHFFEEQGLSSPAASPPAGEEQHADDPALVQQARAGHERWAEQNGVDLQAFAPVTDEQAQAALAFQSGLSAVGPLLYPVPSHNHSYRQTGPDETGAYPPVLIEAAKGTPVFSMTDGLVVLASSSPSLGNFIVVNHGAFCCLYAGLWQLSVSTGGWLGQGQLVGYLGGEGQPMQVSIYEGGVTQDLASFFPGWIGE